MSVPLTVESLVFDGLPAKNGLSGLKLCVNRYIVASQSTGETDGLTLLFTHCIGSHKEVWEPVIERLFQLQESQHKSHRIREAYSFDWQNHGGAAILNEEALKSHPQGVSGYEWAAAIAAFVKAYRLDSRNTVAIGHSYGAGTFVCSTKEFPQEAPPYTSILLVEPTIVSQELYNENIDTHQFVDKMVIKGTLERRDVWEDKDAAIRWLAKRPPWKYWGQRALELHATHALRTIGNGPGVTLSCTKQQEVRCWAHMEPNPEAGKPPRSTPIESAELFKTICKKTPIHIIWGSRNTFNPAYIQDSLSDASQGRVAASVTTVEGAGHFVVQEKPEALSHKIADALNNINVKHTPVSKL